MNSIASRIQKTLENSRSCSGREAELLALLSDAQDEILRLEKELDDREEDLRREKKSIASLLPRPYNGPMGIFEDMATMSDRAFEHFEDNVGN